MKHHNWALQGRSHVAVFASVIAGALSLAGCGGSGDAEAQGNGGDGSSGELTKVTFVESLDVFPYEVVTVADEKGFFADNGIEIELITSESEMQAIASGGAEFAVGGSLTTLDAAVSGIDALTIFATMEGLGMNTAYSNELVEEAGISLEGPLEERVRALEGKTIGITGPGGDDEVFFRYFLSQAGLDPDEAVEFAYIGGTPERIAAMDSGQISAYMSSIPAAELAVERGVGQRMIVPTEEEIPGLEGIPYTGVHVMDEYAADNPEVVKSVGLALSEAANFMRENHEESIDIVAAQYPELSREVVASGMGAIFPAIPENGAMTQEGWDNLRDVAVEAEIVPPEHEVTEGDAWTNEYLAD